MAKARKTRRSARDGSASGNASLPKPIGHLRPALAAVLDWCERLHIPCVIIGGVAVSAMSRPRVTADVDALVLVPDEQWRTFLQAAERHRIVPRIGDPLGFARRHRVLLLRHQPTNLDIDISLGALPFEHDVIDESRPVKFGQLSVPLPRYEDLIIMKAVAHRDKDLIDIAALLEASPKLNISRIRQVLREFAGILETPELVTTMERLLSARRKRR